MYGYVRPDKGELRVREYELFHAVYCGLCQALRERYGFLSRFAVNYDMTFMALVLLSENARAKQLRCPVHPLRKRPVVHDSQARDAAADYSVILAWCKLRDNVRDEKAMKALSDFLRPEFINRVDEIICFNRLSEENFRAIAGIMLGELRDSLADRGIAVRWSDDVIDYLVEKSFSVTYGARNLRRTIQRDIEDQMAQRIIESYENPISQMGIRTQDGKIILDAL